MLDEVDALVSIEKGEGRIIFKKVKCLSHSYKSLEFRQDPLTRLWSIILKQGREVNFVKDVAKERLIIGLVDKVLSVIKRKERRLQSDTLTSISVLKEGDNIRVTCLRIPYAGIWGTISLLRISSWLYFLSSRTNYWVDPATTERELGERIVVDNKKGVWFSYFAPWYEGEVIGIPSSNMLPSDLGELTEFIRCTIRIAITLMLLVESAKSEVKVEIYTPHYKEEHYMSTIAIVSIRRYEF